MSSYQPTSTGIPIIKIRRSRDRFIFIMGLPIHGKTRPPSLYWDVAQVTVAASDIHQKLILNSNHAKFRLLVTGPSDLKICAEHGKLIGQQRRKLKANEISQDLSLRNVSESFYIAAAPGILTISFRFWQRVCLISRVIFKQWYFFVK